MNMYRVAGSEHELSDRELERVVGGVQMPKDPPIVIFPPSTGPTYPSPEPRPGSRGPGRLP